MKTPKRLTSLAVAALALAGCHAPTTGTLSLGPADGAPPPHRRAYLAGTAPNYDQVLPTDRINTLAITVASKDWEAMLADLGRLFGPRGVKEDNQVPGPEAKAAFVPATITFKRRTWKQVGLRAKGSSSLKAAWRDGTDRLPWKLDFNQYVDDQRFFGFRQLSLSTNWSDATAMRDPIVNDVLEAAGLPACRWAYYQVTLDHGTGAQPMGLYTAIEVVDDTMVPRVFGSSTGNLYEPEGAAAGLAAGTRDQIPASFARETNKKGSWDDVYALYDALHAGTRTTDPAAWRAGLDAVFDTKAFLKWLAVVAACQAWDTYGVLAHNYYLYDDPADHRFKWISWDHNLDLGAPPWIDFQFDRKAVGAEWPLIRFLLDDPVYAAQYQEDMRALAAGPFDPARLRTRCEGLAALLQPIQAQPDFRTAVDFLEKVIADRQAVLKAL